MNFDFELVNIIMAFIIGVVASFVGIGIIYSMYNLVTIGTIIALVTYMSYLIYNLFINK
jgi:hypothetical protein